MRAEFKRQTKRDALRRSGGKCEAFGMPYGLEPGMRCGADLGYGVEFDHWDLDANSHDNSIENCVAACKRCHAWKTQHVDIPKAAKTVRQRDKNDGIKSQKRSWPKRQMNPARRSNVRDVNEDMERN